MEYYIDPTANARFAADIDRLSQTGERLGIAVSGGPDSLALLLLMAQLRPGGFEAATVDHALRKESAAECAFVAGICADLGIQHRTLQCSWENPPTSGLQEKARDVRYALLGHWLEERGLDALVTAHHADDQAETLVMRLGRGSGVRGLAGMRPRSVIPGFTSQPLLRPLLDWRKVELLAVCSDAGLTPVEDPSNANDRYERARVRRGMAMADWLSAAALARSAAHLAEADEAIEWAVTLEWTNRVRPAGQEFQYRPSAPAEIRRRVIQRIIGKLASEGLVNELRGGELDRLLTALGAGESGTLRGVRFSGGDPWTFEPAPRRRA